MIQLNQVTELMQKMMNQQTQPQHKPPPAILSPLPSQPLPNLKGRLNAINDKPESEKEAVGTDSEDTEQQLYELLINVTGSKDGDIGEILDFYEEFIVIIRKKSLRKGNWQMDRGVRPKPRMIKGRCCPLTRSMTKRNMKKNSRLNAKTQAHACIVSAAGIVEDVMVKIGRLIIPTNFHVIKPPPRERGHPQVLFGRPFLKTSRFRLTYNDDIFTFSSGKTIETFQITPPPKKKNCQDDGRMRGKEAAQIGMIEALIRELLQKLKEEEGLGKKEKEKESKEKCRAEQKNHKKEAGRSQVDCLSVTEMLNEMEQILYRDKGADAHLIAPRKVYPPPSHFSRRLAAFKASRARDEAGPVIAAPHDDEIVNISSDSDLE
ncbi:hypothetical protein PIB30_040369 [Stylosanthes scabra]|uniref:Uncharacterized protein n=1 Tax=Stylosanthes scabra TaxID=79078 RepID=A0ABU6XDQ3_9FABA|nr:hypothetical protein [Stylosanthes scabra]